VLISIVSYCLRHNTLRRFSFPRVLRCSAGIDFGCYVISGFGRHLGLCDTLSLDVMLYGEFQKYEVMTKSVDVVSRKENKVSMFASYAYICTFSRVVSHGLKWQNETNKLKRPIQSVSQTQEGMTAGFASH